MKLKDKRVSHRLRVEYEEVLGRALGVIFTHHAARPTATHHRLPKLLKVKVSSLFKAFLKPLKISLKPLKALKSPRGRRRGRRSGSSSKGTPSATSKTKAQQLIAALLAPQHHQRCRVGGDDLGSKLETSENHVKPLKNALAVDVKPLFSALLPQVPLVAPAPRPNASARRGPEGRASVQRSGPRPAQLKRLDTYGCRLQRASKSTQKEIKRHENG